MRNIENPLWVIDNILCPLMSDRYLDQTQPNIEDEGEEG